MYMTILLIIIHFYPPLLIVKVKLAGRGLVFITVGTPLSQFQLFVLLTPMVMVLPIV